jgi:hypothetical protein
MSLAKALRYLRIFQQKSALGRGQFWFESFKDGFVRASLLEKRYLICDLIPFATLISLFLE